MVNMHELTEEEKLKIEMWRKKFSTDYDHLELHDELDDRYFSYKSKITGCEYKIHL